MVKITQKADIQTLEHINQVQYVTIVSLQEKIKLQEEKIEHLEQLLRFNPIIFKGRSENDNSDNG